MILELHYGMGIHSDLLPSNVLQQQLKVCANGPSSTSNNVQFHFEYLLTDLPQCLWAAIPMYNASLAFTKFSILFQYLRIFPGRSFRFTCYIMMAIVATYSTWAIISGYVNCVPVAKFWNHDLPGSCLSFEAVWFFNASMNIATDVSLLLLPMPLLSKLQLPRMQKLALMGVFAIGILYVSQTALEWSKVETNISPRVVITSILRLSSLRQVAKSTDTSCTHYPPYPP